jgi:hypothetical protein
LLSYVLPVGPSNFSRDHPPRGNEISKLYNRYTGAFVAIVLNHDLGPANARVQQCRRYVTFAEADSESRTVSIRAMMCISVLYRHLKLPLDELFAWSQEMCQTLLKELQQQDPQIKRAPRDDQVMYLQLLMGSARRVMAHSRMDDEEMNPTYPDIRFLDIGKRFQFGVVHAQDSR